MKSIEVVSLDMLYFRARDGKSQIITHCFELVDWDYLPEQFSEMEFRPELCMKIEMYEKQLAYYETMRSKARN